MCKMLINSGYLPKDKLFRLFNVNGWLNRSLRAKLGFGREASICCLSCAKIRKDKFSLLHKIGFLGKNDSGIIVWFKDLV